MGEKHHCDELFDIRCSLIGRYIHLQCGRENCCIQVLPSLVHLQHFFVIFQVLLGSSTFQSSPQSQAKDKIVLAHVPSKSRAPWWVGPYYPTKSLCFLLPLCPTRSFYYYLGLDLLFPFPFSRSHGFLPIGLVFIPLSTIFVVTSI